MGNSMLLTIVSGEGGHIILSPRLIESRVDDAHSWTHNREDDVGRTGPTGDKRRIRQLG
jgi:hypothetical protein